MNQQDNVTPLDTAKVKKADESPEKLLGGQHTRILLPDEIKRLHDFNKRFAFVTIGGRNFIAKKVKQDTGSRFEFIPSAQFKEQTESLSPIFGKIGEKSGRPISIGAAWIAWACRRSFDGLAFRPGGEREVDGRLNMWLGFGATPTPGNIDPWLHLTKEVICSGDATVYEYLINWCAHLVQFPQEKPGVAIILATAEKGVGKGQWGETMAMLFGDHGFICSTGFSSYLKKFNAILENRVCHFIDEAKVVNEEQDSTLKSLITSTFITLERKGVDPVQLRDCGRFIVASNSDDAVYITPGDRRYLVPVINVSYKGNTDYFNAYMDWRDNGGLGHLLHFLLNHKIPEGFNVREAPHTVKEQESAMRRLTLVDEFLLELLRDPYSAMEYRQKPLATERPVLSKDRRLDVETVALVEAYMGFAAARYKEGAIECVPSRPSASSTVGKRMTKCFVDGGICAMLPRRKHWLINIDEARKAFASMLHIEQELLFDGTCR